MLGRAYDATWGRLFAAGYDRFLRGTEQAGLTDLRRDLLARARGRTLEVGAGTGVNSPLYPAAVSELVLTEPFPPMAVRLRARLDREGTAATVIEASAEELPFADASFDTVVVTLVLCTVDEPGAALSEIARVLAPGGSLLFIEHVRSGDAALARWQDRLERPWRVLGHGCHCNRDTLAEIGGSPLQIDSLEHGELPLSPPIVRPLLIGSASA